MLENGFHRVFSNRNKSLHHTFPFCCNEIMLPSSALHASYFKRQISQCDKQFSSRLITAWISQNWQPMNAPNVAEADSVMCRAWMWIMIAGGGHFQYQQMHGWEQTPNLVQNNQLLLYVRKVMDAELSICTLSLEIVWGSSISLEVVIQQEALEYLFPTFLSSKRMKLPSSTQHILQWFM